MDGLNINVVCPFQVHDYLVGLRLKVDGDIKRAPESLFLKKTIDLDALIPHGGSIALDTDYDIKSMVCPKPSLCLHVQRSDRSSRCVQVGSVRARWSLPEYGSTITAAGSSRDAVTAVAVGTTRVVDKATYVLGVGYDSRRRSLSCKARYGADDLSVEAGYESTTGEVVLKGTQKLNSRNSFSPSIALKSKKMSYEWMRKWHGGFINTIFRPAEREILLHWRDRSVTGDWTTKLTLPVDDVTNAKISFSHEWEPTQ